MTIKGEFQTDLTGQTVGYLKIKGIGRKGIRTYYICDCERCGKQDHWMNKGKLEQHQRQGKKPACGCLKGVVHGHFYEPEYQAWYGAKLRLSREPDYQDVSMHQSWYDSYETFLEEVGPCPPGKTSLDRWPVSNGNYEPGNVRWGNTVMQGRNKITVKMDMEKAREMRRLWAKGTFTYASLGEIFGVNRGTCHAVIKNRTWKEKGT